MDVVDVLFWSFFFDTSSVYMRDLVGMGGVSHVIDGRDRACRMDIFFLFGL